MEIVAPSRNLKRVWHGIIRPHCGQIELRLNDGDGDGDYCYGNWRLGKGLIENAVYLADM